MKQLTEKRVSVIVPVYNCEKYIGKCLASILNQSYQYIEVLVVNDGSSDNSQKIIDNMAETDPRVYKLWQHNQGAAAARNYALNYATGDYYLFVDGDDYIGIDYIRDLVLCAEEKQSELVICGYTLVYPQKKMKKIIPGSYVQIEKEEWAYRISSAWGRLYSSSFWKRNNLHFVQEQNSRAEDVPIVLFANAMAKNIQIIHKSDYFYVQHNGSAMNSRKKVLFLFPYIAFEEMYNKICSIETVNSRAFFDIGILKFLAQFEFVIYRQAERTEKRKFREYVLLLLGDDYADMIGSWRMNRKKCDLPFWHKVAIDLFTLRCSELHRKQYK